MPAPRKNFAGFGLLFFLANRLQPQKEKLQPEQMQHNKIAALVRLAIPTVALSVVVMLITVSVIGGFKNGVRGLVSALTGDVVLSEYGKMYNDAQSSIEVPPKMLADLKQLPDVAQIRTVLQDAAIIKADSDYYGVGVMGVEAPWQRNQFLSIQTAGTLPFFSDQDTVPNPIVIPQDIADKLQLKLGDRVLLYFHSSKRVVLRSFVLTSMLSLPSTTQPIVYIPQSTLRRVQQQSPHHYARLELFLHNPADAPRVAEKVVKLLEKSPYVETQSLGINTAFELNPNIFEWIRMLDSNAVILLGLMALVCAFTIINCLLILILDRTYTIGVLQALGMPNRELMKLFLVIATRIIIKGIIPGNLIAWLLCFVQKKWHVLTLDPSTYYLSFVPVEIVPMHWLAVNIGVVILCLLLMLVPVLIISQITPMRAMKFD